MARDLAITIVALCVLGISAWATASVGAFHADQSGGAPVSPGGVDGNGSVWTPTATATSPATAATQPSAQAKPADRTPATNGSATPTPTQSQPPDYDGDGFPDASDRCPTRPETRNGYLDGDGCPDTVATSGAS